MGWKWSIDSFADGDVASASEIISDLREVSGEMNGYIDRDNFRAGQYLRSNVLQEDAANQIWYKWKTGVFGSFYAGNSPRFRVIDGMEIEALTKTGALEIEASVAYERTLDPYDETPRFQAAVFVDDRLVACTFPEGNTFSKTQALVDVGSAGGLDNAVSQKVTITEGYQTRNTLHCNCVVPVQAGTHRIWVGFRLIRKKKPKRGISAFQFEWYDRNLYVRNIVR